jgi:hypothetical protein
MRLLRAGKHPVHVPERRAHARHLWTVDAECRVGPHFECWWPASVLDLSVGGATVALWGWGKPEADISIRLIKNGRQTLAMNAAIQNIGRYEDVWLFGCAFERELRCAELDSFSDNATPAPPPV